MIKMHAPQREPPMLRQSMRHAWERVLDSDRLILGNEVAEFERLWAAACGVAHGVGVGNGLDALEISLRVLGIGPGDEVIVSSMSAVASLLAILRVGAVPVLAEIDPATALAAPDSVAACLGPRCKALLLVHLYGQLRDMMHWMSWCQQAGIVLIEDCAQAHGARWRDRAAGSFGRVAAFSFYPTKNLGALGDAGMLVTNDTELADRARRLRHYGLRDRDHVQDIGMNSRLDELQAAILRERLPWLSQFNARRRAIAEHYRRSLVHSHPQWLAPPQEADAHVYHQCVVTTPVRERLRRHLAERDIETLVHYPVALHEQPVYRGVARLASPLHHARRHADTCLSLPCHPGLTDDEVDDVIAAIRSFRP